MLASKSLWISLLVILGLISTSVAHAQQGDGGYPSDDEVNAIAKKLYCPVCPNTPLDVCETTACRDWRAQIKDQLAQGWTEDQVIDYFVVQYGEQVLAEPERKGFTSLVWVLPAAAAMLGLILSWGVLRAWRAGGDSLPSATVAEGEIDPDILSRIEAELEELR